MGRYTASNEIEQQRSQERSELGHDKRVELFVEALGLPDHHPLEVEVGALPLVHEETVLVELVDEAFDELGLEGELFEEEVLGEGVHEEGLGEVMVEVVYDKVQSLVVAANDGCGPAVGQRKLLLHVSPHRVQLLYAFVNYVDCVLAYQHVVLLNLLGHEVDFLLELVELVHEGLSSLLVPDGLQFQGLLHVLQGLYLVPLVLPHLVHARYADYTLVAVTVEVEQVLVVPTGGLIPQILQQVLYVFLSLLNILEGKNIVLVEGELAVYVLQALKDLEGVSGLVLESGLLLALGFVPLPRLVLGLLSGPPSCGAIRLHVLLGSPRPPVLAAPRLIGEYHPAIINEPSYRW